MTRLLLIAMTAALAGCAQSTVTFLTKVVPGRTAAVDVDNREVVLGRGAAMAFECYEFVAEYHGPCRDFTVDVGDADVAEALRAHLDGFAGATGLAGEQTVSGADDGIYVSAPIERTGALVVARAAGDTTMTVRSRTGTVEFTVDVQEPTADELASE